MALGLENSWTDRESAIEKHTIVFTPPPRVQERVLLAWEEDVISSSQISSCSRKTRLCFRADLKTKFEKN